MTEKVILQRRDDLPMPLIAHHPPRTWPSGRYPSWIGPTPGGSGI